MGMPSDWTSYLDSGYRWNVQPGGTLTFSFYETGSTLYGSTPTGISEVPDAVKDNIRGIMSAMERFIAIDFVEVADSSSTYGQLRFMNDTGSSYAYAYYPSTWGSGTAGDVHLNPGYNNTGSNGWASAPGNHGYQALWHEIGHALGLKHPFEGSVQAPAGLDNFNFTTMTYNFTGGEPTSWMPGDIYVLQQIYGANTSWASGNTTYTFTQTDAFSDGTASYGTASLNALAVIWDGGGNDTLDLSGVSSTGLRIDLTPGTGIVTNASAYNTTSYSDNWGTKEAGTFYLTSTGSFIAYNVTIENAIGSAANDTMIGNAADNVLDGSAGADQMSGGAGDDTYVVDNAGDVVTDASGAGYDQVYATVSYVLPNNVEELFLSAFPGIPGVVGASGSGTDPVINGTGNALDNLLYGNSAANVLDGGAGADTLAGGAGDDTYVVDNAGDVVQENTGEGTDRVNASASFVLPDNVERLQLLGSANINGTGNGLANILYPGAGNNVVNGSAGTDTIDYYYATAGVAVSLALTTAQATGGSGTDTISGIENLTGSDFNDTLTGNDSNNALNGRQGADTMAGLKGNDTYLVDNVGDVVVEAASAGVDRIKTYVSYTLPTNVEQLQLLGDAAINATGNSADNTLYPNGGNNVIDGGAGTDTVDYYYATGGVTVSLATTAAQATGGSGTDTLLGIENLTGSNYADNLTGNDANNVINGRLGADTMAGGLGNDDYYVDNVADVIIEALNGGTDRVISSVTYTLPGNVERLRLTGNGAVDGTGNELNNYFWAGTGNNRLDGGAGTDTVDYYYSSSSVTVSLATTAAQVTGGSGTDTLLNFENLTGSNYADNLTGNGSANVLNGRLGSDILTGGLGQDIFYFADALGPANVDAITDFSVVDDTIRLDDAIFTALTAGNLDAGAFAIGSAAADPLDRIIYSDSTGALYYDVDGIGATSAIQFATVGTGLAMTAADFVVV